jgi:hypothetical protein
MEWPEAKRCDSEACSAGYHDDAVALILQSPSAQVGQAMKESNSHFSSSCSSDYVAIKDRWVVIGIVCSPILLAPVSKTVTTMPIAVVLLLGLIGVFCF